MCFRSGPGARPRTCPHLFQVVKTAHFRPEYVDDYVTAVDQHPIAMGQSFHPHARHPGGMQGFNQMLGDRTDVPVRAAGSDHHEVGERALSSKVDLRCVGGFVVFQPVQHEREDFLGTWAYAGRRCPLADRGTQGKCQYPCLSFRLPVTATQNTADAKNIGLPAAVSTLSPLIQLPDSRG